MVAALGQNEYAHQQRREKECALMQLLELGLQQTGNPSGLVPATKRPRHSFPTAHGCNMLAVAATLRICLVQGTCTTLTSSRRRVGAAGVEWSRAQLHHHTAIVESGRGDAEGAQRQRGRPKRPQRTQMPEPLMPKSPEQSGLPSLSMQNGCQRPPHAACPACAQIGNACLCCSQGAAPKQGM